MTPPPELLRSGWFPFILDFYWRAVPVFFRFRGLSLTSWFRTAEKNRTEGGSPESQHLFGLAWDLAVPEQAGSVVGQVSRDVVNQLQAAGLTAIIERRHVHVQMFPAGVLARAGVTFPR